MRCGLNKWKRGRLSYERTNLRTQFQRATFLISNYWKKVVTRNIYLTMSIYRRSEKNRNKGAEYKVICTSSWLKNTYCWPFLFQTLLKRNSNELRTAKILKK